MLAIILAGGRGERLKPLTETTPKVLLPVQGKALVEHVLDVLRTAGVDEVVLATAYQARKVRDHFAGRDLGVTLRFLEEPTPRGTAGPLLLLREAAQLPREDFLLVNGDNLFDLDVNSMLRFHREHGGAATIALTEVANPSAFGVARLEGNRITEFVEKPAPERAPSRLINAGYYVLSPAAFTWLPPKAFAMLEYDLWPALARAGKLFAYRDAGQWFDTGTPEQYERVQREWRNPAAKHG